MAQAVGLDALASIRPGSGGDAPELSPKAARAVATAHGFVPRDPVVQRNRQLGTDEPTRSFTTRVSIRAANRFIAYCERERISYREAFDRLTEQLPDA